jgi:hypothetical protein
MIERRITFPLVALAGCVVLAGGCYYGQEGEFVARPRPGGPPPGARAGGARAQSMGIGASAGFFMPNDSVYADGLASGFMWDIHASLWLSPMLAVQVDFARSTMRDRGDTAGSTGLGGQMTVSPLTVAVIASLPMPAFYGPMGMPGPGFQGSEYYRWRFGGGLGTMMLSHTEYDVPDSVNVAYVTAGAEWIIGYGDRFFAVTDVYFGDLVSGQSGLDTWKWDLLSTVTLRAGVEIGF